MSPDEGCQHKGLTPCLRAALAPGLYGTRPTRPQFMGEVQWKPSTMPQLLMKCSLLLLRTTPTTRQVVFQRNSTPDRCPLVIPVEAAERSCWLQQHWGNASTPSLNCQHRRTETANKCLRHADLRYEGAGEISGGEGGGKVFGRFKNCHQTAPARATRGNLHPPTLVSIQITWCIQRQRTWNVNLLLFALLAVI